MAENKIIKASITILIIELICTSPVSSEEQSNVELMDETKQIDTATGSIIVEQCFLCRPPSGRLNNMCWW